MLRLLVDGLLLTALIDGVGFCVGAGWVVAHESSVDVVDEFPYWAGGWVACYVVEFLP